MLSTMKSSFRFSRCALDDDYVAALLTFHQNYHRCVNHKIIAKLSSVVFFAVFFFLPFHASTERVARKRAWKVSKCVVAMHARTTVGNCEKRCRRSICLSLSLSSLDSQPPIETVACAWVRVAIGVADATPMAFQVNESLFSSSSISRQASFPFNSSYC